MARAVVAGGSGHAQLAAVPSGSTRGFVGAELGAALGQNRCMLNWRVVGPKHVKEALQECDDLGSDAFLAKYGYSPSRTYHLVHNGREYPSKAIIAVAYGRATGVVPNKVLVDGGRHGAARVLRRLGFEVTGD